MKPRKPWTDDEWQLVKSLLGQGYSIKAIAPIVGRPRHEISSKKQWEALARERQAGTSRERVYSIPDDLAADRNARAMAPRSLTAIICGDPPPGWSALDRRAS